MSRTIKDQPYIVRVNHGGSNVVDHHDHRDAGKEVYRLRPVLDKDGEKVYEHYYTQREVVAVTIRSILHNYEPVEYRPEMETRHSWKRHTDDLPDPERILRSFEFQKLIKSLSHYGPLSFQRHHQKLVHTVVVYEEYLFGTYPEECDIDRKETHRSSGGKYGRDELHLCYRSLNNYGDGNRYSKKSRLNKFHGGARAVERDTLQHVARRYNQDQDNDLYGDDYEQVNTRPQMNYCSWYSD
jgi:hypothetical protein